VRARLVDESRETVTARIINDEIFAEENRISLNGAVNNNNNIAPNQTGDR